MSDGASHRHCCPRCGYSLQRDELVEIDGFSLDPRGLLRFEGRCIEAVTGLQVRLLHGLAAERGRPLTARILCARTCSTARPSQHLFEQFKAMRDALVDAGAPWPVKHRYRVGYFWDMPRG